MAMATEEQWLCDLRHFTRIEKVEPCNAPKCGMARLQMETNLAALGDCGRYARMMPVSIFNSGDCLICGEALANDQQLFGTWGVFSVPAGLECFCDAVIHWSCYANWPHRAEFAKAYFDFWVDEEKHNRCWAKAFHDEQVFMTVNPFIAEAGEAILVLASTGSRLRVEMDEWQTWLEAPEMSDGEPMHPIEIAEMQRIAPVLKAALPTEDDVMNALDGESKGWTRQT